MFCVQETGRFSCPVPDPGFTPAEIQELLSLFHEGEPNRTSYSVEDYESKRRRKISNRESARRSRWRKKWHLEKLTEKANRLEMENRGMKNKLDLLLKKSSLVLKENNRLRFEAVALSARLSDLYWKYVAMQSH